MKTKTELDREFGVIKDPAEILGWEILHMERWKPGVVKFFARKLEPYPQFKSGFARDEIFSQWQLPK